MQQKLAKVLRAFNFQGGSEFNRAYEGPLKGSKMTVMDILEILTGGYSPPKKEY